VSALKAKKEKSRAEQREFSASGVGAVCEVIFFASLPNPKRFHHPARSPNLAFFVCASARVIFNIVITLNAIFHAKNGVLRV
jgi:hypothetical protein